MGVAREFISVPMLMLSTAVMIFEKALSVLLQLYDIAFSSPLQLIFTPIVMRVPRHVTVSGQKVSVFTANFVTWGRSFLVIPFAISVKYGFSVTAFWLIILHEFLDELDGIVARAHRRMFPGADDPLLGGFMDAFCDKIVYVLGIWSLLLSTDFSAMTPWYGTLYLTACTVIIGYEFVLGVVRVQDYFRFYHLRELFGREEAQVGDSTSAGIAGKVKATLQAVGIACLSLASPQPMCVAGWIGVTCLFTSIRLAHASLAEKLTQRRSLQADLVEKEKDGLVKKRKEEGHGKTTFACATMETAGDPKPGMKK